MYCDWYDNTAAPREVDIVDNAISRHIKNKRVLTLNLVDLASTTSMERRCGHHNLDPLPCPDPVPTNGRCIIPASTGTVR